MNFVPRIQSSAASWWNDTPLPTDTSIPTPIFQTWHEFDDGLNHWRPTDAKRRTSALNENGVEIGPPSRPLVLATWNIDAFSPLPEARIEAILSRILTPDGHDSSDVDIILLQEVSTRALSTIVDDARIRKHWFLSDSEPNIPLDQAFMTVTLLSKARFGYPKESSERATLGAVWRVNYPSHFDRDALCCDVLIPSSSSSSSSEQTATRVRLINVHLDSLPIQPSLRPQQLATAASLLRSSERGLIAGDFNPVLPEDSALVEQNGLVDAWSALHPEDPGFTWGVDGDQPFPPNRMDKVATLGLQMLDMKIMHPRLIDRVVGAEEVSAESSGGFSGQEDDETMPWSDHSGLKCSFRLAES